MRKRFARGKLVIVLIAALISTNTAAYASPGYPQVAEETQQGEFISGTEDTEGAEDGIEGIEDQEAPSTEDEQIIERVTSTKIILPKPVREGYKFIEWNTDIDGQGVSFREGDTFEITSTTLYAIWERTESNVLVIDANGGEIEGQSALQFSINDSFVPNTQRVFDLLDEYGIPYEDLFGEYIPLIDDITDDQSDSWYVAEDTIILPEPVRDGYEFVEYSTDPMGERERYMAGSLMQITDTMLYAVWECKEPATPSNETLSNAKPATPSNATPAEGSAGLLECDSVPEAAAEISEAEEPDAGIEGTEPTEADAETEAPGMEEPEPAPEPEESEADERDENETTEPYHSDEPEPLGEETGAVESSCDEDPTEGSEQRSSSDDNLSE